MSIYTELTSDVERKRRGVAIGTFDGMHLGHQELLRRLVMRCRREGLVPTVFTFSTHPETIFGETGSFPGYLMDEEHRLAAFKALGIEDIFIFPLVPDIYELSAEQFLNRWLFSRLNAKLIAVGRDASFGAGKTGGTSFLKDWCKRNGVTALIVDDIYLEGEKVSSTRIRKALLNKEVELANRMLVHPYRLRGFVERGRNLGHKHGVPTANFSRPAMRLALPHGVYASRVEVDGRWHDAVSNIGLSPTVDPTSDTVRIESFLFDFNEDLYGKPIQVELLKFLREEKTYESFEAMMPQIELDLEETKRFLAEAERPVHRMTVNGVPIISVDTKRFSFGHAALLFRRRAVKGMMAPFALLLQLMTRRTSRYPRPFELEQRLAFLADAGLRPIVSQEGDVQVLGLEISAAEKKDGERHLMAAIDLLFDALQNVFFDIDEPTFDEWLSREKEQLINIKLAEKDNKVEYAMRLALESLLGDQPHALSLLGDIAEIEAVTKADLMSAYDALLSDAHAAFYVSADIDNDLLDGIAAHLRTLPVSERLSIVDTWPVEALLKRQPDRKHVEDSTQHIVVWSVRNAASWYESDRWADILLNQLLDGDQHAFLFRELRGRQSLCYQVFTAPFGVIGFTMFVAATTNENAECVKEAFAGELQKVANGQFTDADEATAKRFLDKALVSSWDRSANLLYSMVNWHIYGQPSHIEDKRAFAASSHRDDLIRSANLAEPLMTFELTGEGPKEAADGA